MPVPPDQLRTGVERATLALGAGFLQADECGRLLARLSSCELSPRDYYRRVLRAAYRLLFRLLTSASDPTAPALEGLEDVSCAPARVDEAAGHLSAALGRRRLDVRTLGGVYEGLLELEARLDLGGRRLSLEPAARHERKERGSYYTPAPVVDCLLDATLEPVLDEAARQVDPEAALLDLTVCDPACGAGWFLLAAGKRIARRLAAVRAGTARPAAAERRRALRDVLRSCLCGADLDPLAVELCRVGLSLEAGEGGLAPSSLDVRCGDSLLGATDPWARRIDVVVGNPPYGPAPRADSDRRRRLTERFGDAWDGTNVANFFLGAGLDLLRSGGRLGFVLPKSLTYVRGYAPSRVSVRRRAWIETLTDVGRGFSGVGLEQVVLTVRRPARDEPAPTAYRSRRLGSDGSREVAATPYELADALGTWPLYLDERGQELVDRVRRISRPLRELCLQRRGRTAIFRGVGFQSRRRYHAEPGRAGAVPLLGGRNITSFVRWQQADEPWLYCDTRHPDLSGARALERQRRRRIACKNVVSSVVKVEATVLDEDVLTLDTINNVLVDPQHGVPLEYLLAVLNSRLSAWLLRHVLFNRAELTMHLDAHYLGALLVPEWTGAPWQRRVVELAETLLATPARKLRKGVTDLGEVHGPLRRRLDAELEAALGIRELPEAEAGARRPAPRRRRGRGAAAWRTRSL